MNVLDLMVAIHDATGVDIPEANYPKILILNDFATYLGPASVSRSALRAFTSALRSSSQPVPDGNRRAGLSGWPS